jgi:dihydrofolate reductase
MANLVYTGITSLDGYVNDENGNFDWAAPDEEVHGFINDLEREVGTYLYGRRLYVVMAVWETMRLDDEPAVVRDFAELWRAAEKVVYSRTLTDPLTQRTRLEGEFDPDAIGAMKAAATSPISVGGPTLAAEAIRAGLVDEFHQFVTPVIVGGGTPFLPERAKLKLELLDERRFADGTVHLHYRTRA